jgi:K+-sensing histidine kinase KdpD
MLPKSSSWIGSPPRWQADVRRLSGALGAIAVLTVLYSTVLHVTNPTTVAISFLLVVVLTAAFARLPIAVGVSIASTLALNYFFIPPIGTFRVSDPENWMALVAFLAASVVASSVSAATRARTSEALKSALLASLGHDLRTPLTAIQVATENLQAGWLAEEERRAQCEIVQSEVARLTRLFDNILDMARIEAGEIAIDREWVPPAAIVDAAQAQAESSLRDRRVEIEDDGSSARMVRLDPRLTSAALAHLLSNAARYSPAGTPIAVAARVTGEGLELSVRDRGAGVPQADLPHLFDRFYRGANARRTAGLGMGLAIARGLLAAERGRISAANCPDGGARFTIVVPAESRPFAESLP